MHRRHLVLTFALAGVALSTTACLGTRSGAAVTTGGKTTRSSVALAVAPLTGLEAPAPIVTTRPALSVKIDNITAALPQAGLNQADIVTEDLVEGGLTRLLATYQSEDAKLVGPIRSARPVDAPLLRELGGGIFAYSGAAAGEIAPVIANSDAVRLDFDSGNPAFFQMSGRVAPHQVFSSTPALYKAGYKAGASHTPPPALFTYSKIPPSGTPVSSARLAWSDYSSAVWTWDPSASVWLRNQDGSADVLADGSRVSATNVVILSVGTGPTGIYDAAGNQDPLPLVIGSGDAWVLRNGQVTKGTWTRASLYTHVTVDDQAGNRVPLEPGRTWLELLNQPNMPTFS